MRALNILSGLIPMTAEYVTGTEKLRMMILVMARAFTDGTIYRKAAMGYKSSLEAITSVAAPAGQYEHRLLTQLLHSERKQVSQKIISRKEAIDKGLRYYFTGKPCKNGHLSIRSTKRCSCLECDSEAKRSVSPEKKKELAQKALSKRNANIEAARVRENAYNERNRERRRLYAEWYRLQNKEYFTEYNKRYAIENKEAIRETSRKYLAKLRKESARYKSISSMRKFLARMLSYTGAKKNGKTEQILGYSRDDLVGYISSLFETGMSWENHGEWHIDHIKPISAFIDDGIYDAAVINALSNLQPLWAKDNLSKGAKYQPLSSNV